MESEVSAKEQPKKRSRRFMWGAVVLGVALVPWLLYFLERPVFGTITVGKPKTEEGFDKKQEKKLYSGKYVTFSYAGGYVEKRHDFPTGGPIQEVIFLSREDVEGQKIAVTVAKRGTNDLESDPSFKMRLDSEEYFGEPWKIGELPGFLFEKKTSVYEATAFFADRGTMITVSLTSPTSAEGLREELSELLESIRLVGE